MSGALITITQDVSQVQKLLNQILARLDDARPVFAVIGEIVTASVQRNFEDGGRPEQWEPLAPSTLRRKKNTDILKEQGFAGGLLGSIHPEPEKDQVAVGTDKIYAAIHQFGGTIKQAARSELFVRNRKGGKFAKGTTAGKGLTFGDREIKIPARPFLLVQDEDWTEISAAVTEFIIEGRA